MARAKSFDETRVLSQMMAVFWRQGYEATSMRHLAQATKLSAGSIYHEFGSKQKLFNRTLRFYINTVIDFRIQKYLIDPDDALDGIRQFIISAFAEVPQAFSRQSCLLVNSAAELGQSDPLIGQTIRQGFIRLEQAMRDCVEIARDAGQIDSRLDSTLTARQLSMMLPGLLIAAKNGVAESQLKQLVEQQIATLQPH